LDEGRGEEGSDSSDSDWLSEYEPVVLMESVCEGTLFALPFSTSELRRYTLLVNSAK
jgi:hypothetical protein